MKLLEKLLLPTDFSEASQDAMETAIYVAKRFKSRITLLHVIPDLKTPMLAMDMVKTNVVNELNKIEKRLASDGIKVEKKVVVQGVPSVDIISEADRIETNVIILGSGGKEVDEEPVPGLTAERVMRRSKIPVWIARRGSGPPYQRILCTVDLSASSTRALKNAIHLARRFEAELTVLYVIQTIPSFYLSLSKKVAEREAAKQAEAKREQFTRFLKDFDFHQVQWRAEVKQGDADKEILAAVRHLNSDLLIMGSAGLGSNPRIQLGRVTEKVMRRLPCSLVTVKAQDLIQLNLDYQVTSLQTHMKQGTELLENGFPEEAKSQFQICLDLDVMYGPAWEGLAGVYQRMGQEKEAENCKEKARQIRRKLWEKQVEEDIRRRHPLTGKGR